MKKKLAALLCLVLTVQPVWAMSPESIEWNNESLDPEQEAESYGDTGLKQENPYDTIELDSTYVYSPDGDETGDDDFFIETWDEEVIEQEDAESGKEIWLDDCNISAASVEDDTAENGITISVESKMVRPGTSFQVNVNIKNNPGITYAALKIAYDERLTLTGIREGNAFSYLRMVRPPRLNSPCIVSWNTDIVESDFFEEGTIMTLDFEAADTFDTLDSLIDLPVSVTANEDILDAEFNQLEVNMNNGIVTIVNYIPGDVNGDKKVTVKDVVLTRRLLSGEYGVDASNIKLRAANVNGDMRINSADVIYLRRYLAGGYDITLQSSDDICFHTMEATARKEATCTEPGNTAYWYCTTCGKYFSDKDGTAEIQFQDIIIPAIGHTIVVVPEVKPTASKPGLTEGQYCSVCGTVIVEQQEWLMDTFSIKYDIANGDSYLLSLTIENSNPATIVTGESLHLEDLEVPGYKFLGWYDGAGEDAERVTDIENAGHNYKLYAHWDKIKYKVQFNSDLMNRVTGTEYLIDPIEYTVDTGAVIPRPYLSGYVFLCWTNDGEIINNAYIPAGTTKNMTLTANWTSQRNRCFSKKNYGEPVITDDGNDVLFVYEIGKIENVPLYTIHDFGYIQEEGIARTEQVTYSTAITETAMESFGQALSNATVKSSTWTLSDGWTESTTYEDTWYKENQNKVGESETYGRSETGTWNISNGSGGSSSSYVQDSASSNEYNSTSNVSNAYSRNEYNEGAESHLNGVTTAELHTDINIGNELGALLQNVNTKGKNSDTTQVTSKGSTGINIGGSLTETLDQGKSENYGRSQYSDGSNTYTENWSKDTSDLHNEGSSSSGYWNTNASMGASKTTSASQTRYHEITDIVGETHGYGRSYITEKNVSNTEGHSYTASASEEYGTMTVYSKVGQETVTSTWSTQGTKPGYHRWVQGGTMHVFGVVGYNYETKSFYVSTYSLMDDVTAPFEDYSYVTSSYDDQQNGVIPFVIPDDIKEYVMNKTGYTDGLVINQVTGVIEGYAGSSNLVFIPELFPVISYSESGTAHYDNIPVTGISSNAFKGNTAIQAVILPDTISEIPDGAFEGCTSLWKVYGAYVDSIGENAFKGCTAIKDAFVSVMVDSLGENAYEGVGHLYIGVANESVAQAAAKSGADRITMFTGNLADRLDGFSGKKLEIPDSARYFEFNGNDQTFCGLSITSDAQETVLNKMIITDGLQLPLRISSPDIVLNQVKVNSKGIAAALTADNVNLGLQSTIEMTSDCGTSMLARSMNLMQSNTAVVGTLSVSDELDVYGTVTGLDHLARNGNEIISIDSQKFDSLLNAAFVSLDPDGGICDKSYLLLENGQNAGTLPVPVRTGFTFSGWYLENGQQLTDSDTFGAGECIKAAARWAPEQYSVSWSTGTGKIITVTRTSSPNAGASIGTLSNGSAVYYGDTLSVSYRAADGFTLTGNGSEMITVEGNVTSSNIYANVTPKTFKASWNTGTGYSITVRRTSSPYKGASTGDISNGGNVYYGDMLSISYTPASNYRLTSSGLTSIRVTGNVTSSLIYAAAELDAVLIRVSEFYPSNCPFGRTRSHLEIYNLNHSLYIKGWVYDTANPGASTQINVNFSYTFDANLPSPDCPVGGNHGFEGVCSGLEARTMIHTWVTDRSLPNNGLLTLWDCWIDYDNNSYYGVTLDP